MIEYTTIVLTRTPDDDPGLPGLLSALGVAHNQRFQRLGDMDDMEKSIEYKLLAIALTPVDHPDIPRRLINLSVSHNERFKRLGELGDIEKAIEYDTRAVAVTPNDHTGLPVFLEKLGSSHLLRFQRLGELHDLEQGIDYQSRGLALAPEGHPRLPLMLANLARSHNERFQRLGKLDDLERAFQYDSRALALTPDGHPDFSTMLANLGTSHSHRFDRLDELDDLEKAIGYTSRALALIPENHPDLSMMLANLGTSHRCRFQRLGNLGDLQKAIEYGSRALALTPDGHTRLSSQLSNLGNSHSSRFKRLGELDDLEKSIRYQSRALALTPDGHPDLSIMFSNLGTSHSYRFQRLGELDDLEKAIEYQSRVVALTPDGHPNLPIYFANLGAFHIYRFERLGELDDVEKSIEHESRALALIPNDHPDLSIILANLGLSNKHRFQRLHELDDLQKAIDYESRALALTPDGHSGLSCRLANLGGSHFYRFERLGELGDIENAIEYQSRALALTPDGHPYLSGWLLNLGSSHRERYKQLGKLSDLEKAIECRSCALELTANDDPESCIIHVHLALSYVDYYGHTNDPSHLRHSLHSFRIASMSLVGPPRERFLSARQWACARHASHHSALNCIEAYQATIDLLPQLIWLGATTTQRYEDLKTTETLAVDAATAAILSSNYSLALEWLEHARCVVWNQNLMLRSPLDQLQASHPTLATHLQSVAERLHNASSESRESQAFLSSTTPEQVAQDHRRLAKEYNELLTQTRTLPGFEDFLQPIKANRLVHAARNGPIVIINCHEDRCDALLILPEQDEVNHLPLSRFDGKKARRACHEMKFAIDSQRRRERGVERRPLVEEGQKHDLGSVLADLWSDVVKPILDFLRLADHVPVGNLPHITWCPTGAMSFLPLHAAGDYDQPRSKVFDYVISSYTPTLTALLESTPYSLTRNSRVLAIGQTATPGHSRLPGTAMELERVKAHTHNKAEYSQLIDNQATITAVLDAMEQHDWVHLACHAHQNVGNATESGFFLHDGVLDLASINRRSLKNKGLAYLSACQTATGDENLPDEAVHLASGMLMAGYTSVIATMWSVVDSDAPLVADKVYSELMKNGKLGNGEAGKALHNAVAGLRKTVGEKEFGRWVPFIHIGS